jgi:hypothetical protein
MALEEPTARSTVEWGEEDVREPRWWERLVGREPTGAAEPSTGSNAAVFSCAGVAFVLVLAAVALPWVRIAGGDSGPTTVNPLPDVDRLTLGQLYSFLVFAYGLSVLLLFACVGALMTLPAAGRRPLSGIALGLTAGQLACVFGIAATIQGGGDVSTVNIPGIADRMNFGEGLYAAIAAAVMSGVTIVVANRKPGRRPAGRPDLGEYDTDSGLDDGGIEVRPVDRGPIDLTVTPLRRPGEAAGGPWSGR